MILGILTLILAHGAITQPSLTVLELQSDDLADG